MAGNIEYNGEMLSLSEISRREKIPSTSLLRRYNELGNIYEAVKICKENLVKKIEYKGEQLALKTIAKIEKLSPDSLYREYENTGDIYQAVQKCIENKNKRQENIEYIEYKGEMLSIEKIAKMEALSKESLRRVYKEKKDIYEAVKICKENQQIKNGTIEYNGEYLTLAKIAVIEKIPETTLKRNYDVIGNIYETVKKCKENQQNRKGTIEYNGETLNISTIAEREHLSLNPLIKKYQELGDIYEAVKTCKQNQKIYNGTIEYNGEVLTISAIAAKEDLSISSLSNAYKKIGDIYEAINACKENKRNKNTLIEYNGKPSTISTIAKNEGLSEDSLKKAYNKIGNIYEAVETCRNNQRGRTYEFNGEKLTMAAIATKEKLGKTQLGEAYKKTGDIYEAVRICKENQNKRKESVQYVEYNGETLSIKAIAQKEGIVPSSLKKSFNKTNDIYEAVKTCKEAKTVFHGSIEYNGEMLSLKEISQRVNIPHTTLTSRYKETGNIYKAVFICQSVTAERERRKAKVDTKKYGEISYYDLSLILGIKYGELKNFLDKGYTAEQIANMNLRPTLHRSVTSRVDTKLLDGQSLREYCVENKLNYACIYRAINTYGKSLDSAVDYYKKYGQQIPSKWIYEKYGVLLKHLLLKDGIDVKNVVEYMRSDLISLDEAVEKYIVRRNAKKDGLNEEWMTELYDVLTDENIANEYDEYLKAFYVDDKEEECVIKSYDEVENFKRKELLFEISQALNEGLFKPEEEAELLKQYDIKPREIETMFLELYDRFEEPGVLRGEDMHIERTPEEMEKINGKIQKYQQMIQDRQVISVMHTSVNEKVGENQETRQELNTRLKEKEDKNKQHN